MTGTLVDLATTLGWTARVLAPSDFSTEDVGERSIVVIASQGHGDEEAVALAVSAEPLFVGLVASRKRGEALLAYLAEREVPQHLLDRVRTPVGLDLGHTSHQEIAVSVLAELVMRRAAGEFSIASAPPQRQPGTVEVVDPVCGMTVVADHLHFPVEHEGTTYWFCCAGCSTSFAADPARYLSEAEA
jgi:xanthine dehydrogenase accessory factor